MGLIIIFYLYLLLGVFVYALPFLSVAAFIFSLVKYKKRDRDDYAQCLKRRTLLICSAVLLVTVILVFIVHFNEIITWFDIPDF